MARRIRRLGASAFLDEEDIEFGDETEEDVFEALGKCSELVVLLTPRSVARPWVWMEIGAARAKRKRIVGVRHGLSHERLMAQPGMPVLLTKVRLLGSNELDGYYRQLGKRIGKTT